MKFHESITVHMQFKTKRAMEWEGGVSPDGRRAFIDYLNHTLREAFRENPMQVHGFRPNIQVNVCQITTTGGLPGDCGFMSPRPSEKTEGITQEEVDRLAEQKTQWRRNEKQIPLAG